MAATEKGQITEWPQSLVWALFDQSYGAADALESLKAADDRWLIGIDNAAVVSKNQDGGVEFSETGDRSGEWSRHRRRGRWSRRTDLPARAPRLGRGWGGRRRAGQIRDAGFEDNALRAAASERSRTSRSSLP